MPSLVAPSLLAPSASSAWPFDFERDALSFANELLCEYRLDPGAGRLRLIPRVPRPAYAHRCFVLARAVRQFHFHATFDPGQPARCEEEYRRLVRAVLGRNPRRPSPPARRVVIPGHVGLRDFSRAWERVIKAESGGAWRSYVLRSHWRMVFPISRAHQARTAAGLEARLQEHYPPIVHLVRFPQLTINHGMVIFDAAASLERVEFQAYDPNNPDRPQVLTYDRARRTFELPANRYWMGGPLNLIEIYRSPWL